MNPLTHDYHQHRRLTPPSLFDRGFELFLFVAKWFVAGVIFGFAWAFITNGKAEAAHRCKVPADALIKHHCISTWPGNSELEVAMSSACMIGGSWVSERARQ